MIAMRSGATRLVGPAADPDDGARLVKLMAWWRFTFWAFLTLVTPGDVWADDKPPPTGAGSGQRNWSSFRGDMQLTGVARGDLPERLAVRWRYEAPEAITSSAAIVDGVVYVGCDDEHLYAIDLEEGSVKWRYHSR